MAGQSNVRTKIKARQRAVNLGCWKFLYLAKNLRIFPIDLIWLKVWSDRARHSGRHVFH